MKIQLDATSRIVLDVLTTAFGARWTGGGELEPEARSVARQVERIGSHRDAELALRRTLASSFGNPAPFSDSEIALAGRLLWLRLRAEGLVTRGPDIEGYSADEILELVSGDLHDTVFTGDPWPDRAHDRTQSVVAGGARASSSESTAVGHVDANEIHASLGGPLDPEPSSVAGFEKSPLGRDPLGEKETESPDGGLAIARKLER
jgi:hypothetical protein